jgi:hypothetical protein
MAEVQPTITEPDPAATSLPNDQTINNGEITREAETSVGSAIEGQDAQSSNGTQGILALKSSANLLKL